MDHVPCVFRFNWFYLTVFTHNSLSAHTSKLGRTTFHINWLLYLVVSSDTLGLNALSISYKWLGFTWTSGVDCSPTTILLAPLLQDLIYCCEPSWDSPVGKVIYVLLQFKGVSGSLSSAQHSKRDTGMACYNVMLQFSFTGLIWIW